MAGTPLRLLGFIVGGTRPPLIAFQPHLIPFGFTPVIPPCLIGAFVLSGLLGRFWRHTLTLAAAAQDCALLGLFSGVKGNNPQAARHTHQVTEPNRIPHYLNELLCEGINLYSIYQKKVFNRGLLITFPKTDTLWHGS